NRRGFLNVVLLPWAACMAGAAPLLPADSRSSIRLSRLLMARRGPAYPGTLFRNRREWHRCSGMGPRATGRAGGQGERVNHHPEIPAYARFGSGSFPTGAGRLRASVAEAARLQGVLLA